MAFIKRVCKNRNCNNGKPRTFSTQDERKVYCTRQCGINWRGRKHYNKNMAVVRDARRAARKAAVTV